MQRKDKRRIEVEVHRQGYLPDKVLTKLLFKEERPKTHI
jgi:hypothetical protein